MLFKFYITIFLICISYICVTDSNVLDWISIKLNHFIVYLQMQYIKLKWKFKKF